MEVRPWGGRTRTRIDSTRCYDTSGVVESRDEGWRSHCDEISDEDGAVADEDEDVSLAKAVGEMAHGYGGDGCSDVDGNSE
jgi:hypothetical protein